MEVPPGRPCPQAALSRGRMSVVVEAEAVQGFVSECDGPVVVHERTLHFYDEHVAEVFAGVDRPTRRRRADRSRAPRACAPRTRSRPAIRFPLVARRT